MKRFSRIILALTLVITLLSTSVLAIHYSDYGEIDAGNITILNSNITNISASEFQSILDQFPWLLDIPRFQLLSLSDKTVSLTAQDLWVLFVYCGDRASVQDTLDSYAGKAIKIQYFSPGGFIVSTSTVSTSASARGGETIKTYTESYEYTQLGGHGSTYGYGNYITAIARFREVWQGGSTTFFQYYDCDYTERAPTNSYYHFDRVSEVDRQHSGNILDNTAWCKIRFHCPTMESFLGFGYWTPWIEFHRG